MSQTICLPNKQQKCAQRLLQFRAQPSTLKKGRSFHLRAVRLNEPSLSVLKVSSNQRKPLATASIFTAFSKGNVEEKRRRKMDWRPSLETARLLKLDENCNYLQLVTFDCSLDFTCMGKQSVVDLNFLTLWFVQYVCYCFLNYFLTFFLFLFPVYQLDDAFYG